MSNLPSILIVAAIILVGSVAGAGFWYWRDHRIYAGHVVDKSHHAAYTTTIMVPIITGNYTTYIPQMQHHPERWSVTITGEDRRERRGESEWDVAQEEYERRKLGEWVVFGEAGND